MIWKVPPIWEGGEVWILGGGSSVPEQFGVPDSVVNDVVKGISPPSAYSPYMSAIHDKHVIAINVAYLIGTWIDMMFFGDLKFFKEHQTRLVEWPGLKISCHDCVDKVPWVKYLPNDKKHSTGISPDPHMVSWNANSGSAAISVAANTGAKRIILVGFDMNYNNTNHRHWHNLYQVEPVDRKKKVAPRFNRLFSFQRHLQGFPHILRDAKLRGIEIINASPDSSIVEFPKCRVKDLL